MYCITVSMNGQNWVQVDLSYRLVPGVPALLTEGLLVKIDIILVSAEQVVVTVKLHCVCHVVRHKVIKPTHGSREPGFIRLGGQLHQTLHRGNVLLSLVLG